MSNSNNININLKTQSKVARDSLHDLSKSFVTLNKDGKRANTSLKGLTSSLGGLKRVVGAISLYKLSQGLASATQSAMDIRESIHMYNIAMGEFAVVTGEAVGVLSELSGMDRVKMLDTVGEYNLLARSMGLTSKNASVLSENTNRLALDLSALTNRSYVKVSEDLRSGLIGQAKTMYKYGIDVTEASIKQEALNQGIKKSVRHMSQGEKMALRYAVMIRQSALSHGDFANTIESPANQLRIFSDRMLTLTRTIGTIFIPMITKVLPYLNAFAKALNYVFMALARIVGYKKNDFEKIENTTNSIGGGVEGIGDEAGKTGKKIDKLKKKLQALAGFDELNILGNKTPDTPSGGGNGVGDDFGIADLDLEGYDSMVDSIKQKTDEIFDAIATKLAYMETTLRPLIGAFTRLYEEGLKPLGEFAFGTLSDFYNSFLVPMGKWTIGRDGLERFFNITRKGLKEIDWDKLRTSLDGFYKALVPLGEFTGNVLLDFYENVLVPIGVWTMSDAIPKLAEVITDGLGNIDFERIREGFNNLWESLTPYTINVGEGLLWLFENVLVPIGTWVTNEVFTRFLDILANVFKILNKTLEVFKPLGIWLWENFLKPLGGFMGEAFLDALDWMIEKLEDFGKWIDENESTMRFWMVTIGLLSAVLFALSNPFLAVGVGLIALITSSDKLKENWEKLKENIKTMWESNRKVVIEKLDAIVKSVTDTWQKNKETINKRLDEIWKNITDIWEKNRKVVVDNLDAIGKSIKDKWEENRKIMSDKLDAILRNVKETWDNIKSYILTKWDEIKAGIQSKSNSLVDAIKSPFNIAKQWIDGIISDARNWGSNLIGGFIEGINDMKNNVKRAVSGVVDGVADRIGFRSPTKEGVGRYADQWMPNMMNMLVDGIDDNKHKLIGAMEMTMGGIEGIANRDKSDIGGDIQRAITSSLPKNNPNQDGGIIIQIGERTILDTLTDGVNRENRINGKSIIRV